MIIGKMPFQVQRLQGYMIFIQIDLERRKRNNRKGNLPSLSVFFLKFTSLFLHFLPLLFDTIYSISTKHRKTVVKK